MTRTSSVNKPAQGPAKAAPSSEADEPIPPPPKTKSDDYPMPGAWTRVYSKQHKRYFFVEQKLKQTSWTDPRDALWKKKTWAECDPNTDEAPIGWEIAYDNQLGKYFIDHVNQRNVLDDPRSTQASTQMELMKSYIRDANDKAENRATIFKKKSEALVTAKQEASRLKASAAKDDKKVAEKEAENRKLEAETEALRKEVDSLHADVDEMRALAERLEKDDATDQLAQQQRVQAEINALKVQLQEEQQKKETLEREIQELQSTFQQKMLADMRAAAGVTGPMPTPKAAPTRPQSSAPAPVTEAKSAEPQTRIEREMELLALKRKLEQEQREQTLLRTVAEKAKAEVTSAMKMEHINKDASGKPIVPQWIKALNNYASASATVRSNIKSKANKGGDQLTFREKLLLFTSHETPLEKGVAELSLKD
ncbi:Protein wwc2 [Borealophlyctis nickersoniae]|nr:Protein wwc2 [Borealophlyctis nickersoniae]